MSKSVVMVASMEACDWGAEVELAGPLVEYLRAVRKGVPPIRAPFFNDFKGARTRKQLRIIMLELVLMSGTSQWLSSDDVLG